MKKIIAFLVIAVAFACEGDEDIEFGTPATGDFESEPFEFNSTIFRFIPSEGIPDDVLVSWDFGYSTTADFVDRSIEESPLMQFPGPGTYTVTMILTSDAGVSSVRKDVVVQPAEPDALPLEYFFITTFDNPAGKTWVIDRESNGHSGAGRNNSQTANIWNRAAGSMECLGLYNDEYTFLPDLGFQYETGGDIYTRNGFQSDFTDPVFQSAVCAPSLGLSASDIVAKYTAPDGLTWSVSKDAAGKPVLTLSPGGYIGMGVRQTKYEIQVLSADEMYLRFLDGNNAVSWYKRLIPKP